MFALLISLQGWGQSGGSGEPVQPCSEPSQAIPISYSLNALPCQSSDPKTSEFTISVGLGPGAQFFVADPSGQSTITGPTIVNGVYTYTVRFTSTGWRQLVITSDKCYLTTYLDVPVLCDCPQYSYKVLGSLHETNQNVGNTEIAASDNFFVVGNFTFTDNSNMAFSGKTFTVLGKNYYANNWAGGTILGPYITVGNQLLNATSVFCGSNNANPVVFKGDACFGMWGGLNVIDSIGVTPALIMEHTYVQDAYRALGVLTGRTNKVQIENCQFTGNLYGIVARNEGLSKFTSNLVASAEMLKPFDYTIPGHNFNNESITNYRNKFYTRYGLWVHGTRSSTARMMGADWSNNAFNNCIVGQRFDTDFKTITNYFDSELNNFNLNQFSGILTQSGPESWGDLSVRESTFDIANPDNLSALTLQLHQERNLWGTSDAYGVFTANSGGPVDIAENMFTGASSNEVGVYCSHFAKNVEANSFFNLKTGVRTKYIQSKAEQNIFENCSIGFHFEGTSASGLNPRCNRFTFSSGQTAFKFEQGNVLSPSWMCSDPFPCGNKFVNDGFIIDNHASNPSIDYFSFVNEVLDLTIQSKRNARIVPTSHTGRDGDECPLPLLIFTPRIFQGQVNIKGQVGLMENKAETQIIDLTGKVIIENVDLQRDLEKLNKGTYILFYAGKRTLLRK